MVSTHNFIVAVVRVVIRVLVVESSRLPLAQYSPWTSEVR
jgi:hypothetical protein